MNLAAVANSSSKGKRGASVGQALENKSSFTSVAHQIMRSDSKKGHYDTKEVMTTRNKDRAAMDALCDTGSLSQLTAGMNLTGAGLVAPS